MTNEFTREARYVVLKNADITQCLTVNELIELRRIQAKVGEHRAEIGTPPLDCVVVESDWPEYAPTWKAIEARVTGAQPAPSVPEGWKLVPIEPTETMISEGSCASSLHGPHYISEGCAQQCWKYMLAAAPESKS